MSTKRRITCILIFSFSLLLIPHIQAQQPELAQPVLALSALPAEHHDVYGAYFQYHATWIKWAASQASGKSATLNQLVPTFAKLIGVAPTEISVVHSVSLNVTQRINALNAQKAAAVGLSRHDANQFEIRRQQIILSGVRDLQRHLTPVSWGGLHQFVNYDFRVLGTALPGLPIGVSLP